MRKLPRVDAILAEPVLVEHPASHAVKKRAVQQALASRRAALRAGDPGDMSEETADEVGVV
ncbi:MAG TPA: hypothetical protein VGB85_12930, partial [Nannocystis sp.]